MKTNNPVKCFFFVYTLKICLYICCEFRKMVHKCNAMNLQIIAFWQTDKNSILLSYTWKGERLGMGVHTEY